MGHFSGAAAVSRKMTGCGRQGCTPLTSGCERHKEKNQIKVPD